MNDEDLKRWMRDVEARLAALEKAKEPGVAVPHVRDPGGAVPGLVGNERKWLPF